MSSPSDPLGDFIEQNDKRRAQQDEAALSHNGRTVAATMSAGRALPPTKQAIAELRLYDLDAGGSMSPSNREALTFLQRERGLSGEAALVNAPRISQFMDARAASLDEAFLFGGRGSATTALHYTEFLSGDAEVGSAFRRMLALKDGTYESARDVATMVAIRKNVVDPLGADIAAMKFGFRDTTRLTQLHQAMVAGLLAKDSYYDQSIPELMPRGVSRVTDRDLPAGVTPALLNDRDIGYFGALYRNANTGKMIFANRGTHDAEDIRNNVLQALGQEAPQYERAMQLAERLKLAYGDSLSFVGHSLGGGLASAQAVVTNLPAITFNAAGLHSATVARFNGSSLDNARGLIRAYYVQGEALSYLQDRSTMPAGWSRGAGELGGVFAVGEAMPTGARWAQVASIAAGPAWGATDTAHAAAAWMDPAGPGPAMEANFMPRAAGTRYGLAPVVAPAVGLDGSLTPGGHISLAGSRLPFRPEQHFMHNMFNALYQHSLGVRYPV